MNASATFFERLLAWLKVIGARLWSLLDLAAAGALIAVSEIVQWVVPRACMWSRAIAGTIKSMSPGAWLKFAMLGAAALLLSYVWSWRDVAGHWWDTSQGNRPLMAAKSWYYHLDKIDVDKIAKSDADVLVIDYAREGGKIPLTPEEVARLKVKPDGKKRLVISYMSIGEAETYRWYWREDWKGDDMPGWQVMENCAWPRAHMVRFWHDGWKDIIYQGRRPYVKRIIDAGFDGVYLDRIDVYERQTDQRPTARDDMIDFVTDMAKAARTWKPGFLVIAQNAEDLLQEQRYRDVIDGLGKEDLLHGSTGTGVRNSDKDIAWSIDLMRRLQWDYKPVFAVEYLTTKAAIATTTTELNSLGMVPTFQHRSLDGGDPTVARADEKQQYGTPEWIQTECKEKHKPHW
ncbi:MAG: hypothetical protein HOO99_15280 [Hyphomicrobiaceae bacterium]|nr:hypothetical protein [Hyphomicrobiaceae bacterium]